MVALRDNACLERLLGNCRLGGNTSKKTGIGGSLSFTHYFWLCGYNSGHPMFQCTDKNMGNFMNATRVIIQGVWEKNNPAWQRLGQEYVANKISKVNYSNVPVISQVCINSGCSTHCASDRVMVTVKFSVLRVICVGKSDATTMISTHTAYLPLPQISLSTRRIHILPEMKDLWLISVGNLRDDGFSVNFNTNNLFLRKGDYILTGYIDATMGL